MNKKPQYTLKVLAILLAIFVFSPITLSYHNTSPSLLGFPRTLWIGLFVSIGFISLTVIGTYVFNDEENEEDMP